MKTSRKFGILLVSLPLAEVGHRVVSALAGTPFDADSVRAELQRLAHPDARFVPHEGQDEASKQYMLHPFTGAERGHDLGGVLAHFRSGPPASEFSIAVLGGSVAASWANTQAEDFAALLEADPRFDGRQVRLLNFAHPAYKQPQQLMRVAYLYSLGYRPDAVLNLDGFNEVALTAQDRVREVHPVYPSYTVWGNVLRQLDRLGPEEQLLHARGLVLQAQIEAAAVEAEDDPWLWSSLRGRLVLSRARRLAQQRAALQAVLVELDSEEREMSENAKREVTGPPFPEDNALILRMAVENWAQSSISIAALCRARGTHYLHALQPTLHDEGAKPFAPEEQQLGPAPGGWIEGAQAGYPALRARGAELAARGLPFHDASRIFEHVQEPLYYDHCHIVLAGEQRLTQDLARAFLASLP